MNAVLANMLAPHADDEAEGVERLLRSGSARL
jgi:hypothetical protein